jgi:hypothetical protein
MMMMITKLISLMMIGWFEGRKSVRALEELMGGNHGIGVVEERES